MIRAYQAIDKAMDIKLTSNSLFIITLSLLAIASSGGLAFLMAFISSQLKSHLRALLVLPIVTVLWVLFDLLFVLASTTSALSGFQPAFLAIALTSGFVNALIFTYHIVATRKNILSQAARPTLIGFTFLTVIVISTLAVLSTPNIRQFIQIVAPLIATVFLLASYYIIIRFSDESSRWMRPVALIFAVAHFCSMFAPFVGLNLGPIIASLALWIIGWEVLNTRVLLPSKHAAAETETVRKELNLKMREAVRHREHLDRLNNELVTANSYKSEFLSKMSHELRTPLNSIIGYSELLQSGTYGDLNEKQADRMERIYRNGQHLAHLINAILDLNKLETGQLDIQPEPVHLFDLLEPILSDIEPRIHEKHLQMVVDIQDDLPTITVDPLRIRQVISNLLDNALKFTHKGRITIEGSRVRVKNGKTDDFPLPTTGWLPDGDWVLLSVIDTGLGVEPEDQVKIFEQFSQVDATSTSENEGIGLGLSITKRLVEMHGGIIWLRSMPMEGSTFFVALPLKPISQIKSRV